VTADLRETINSFISQAPRRRADKIPQFDLRQHMAALPYHPVSQRIAAVTCYFNPQGSANRSQCYANFARQFPRIGLELFAVEGSLDDRWEIPSAWRYGIDPAACLFAKENLLNLAIARLPDRFDCVLWIDCDIMPTTPDYAERLADAMDRHTVVQGFQYLAYLDASGNAETEWRCGVAAKNEEQGTQRGHPARAYPGGAWCAPRQLLAEVGGLYDRHVTGAGDVAWSTAVYGDAAEAGLDGYWPPPLVEAVARYGRQVSSRVESVGFVGSRAVHLYHGRRANRQYTERHRSLIEAGYDPDRHVEYAPNGTLRWSPSAPAMLRRAVRDYIFGRKEDD
jgi:hypothetical protein